MKKRFKAKIYEADEQQLRGVNISCNIIDDVKAPVWFIEFEKRNNARWDKQDKINEAIITRLDKIEVTLKDHGERLDKIETTLKDHGERVAKLEAKLSI